MRGIHSAAQTAARDALSSVSLVPHHSASLLLGRGRLRLVTRAQTCVVEREGRPVSMVAGSLEREIVFCADGNMVSCSLDLACLSSTDGSSTLMKFCSQVCPKNVDERNGLDFPLSFRCNYVLYSLNFHSKPTQKNTTSPPSHPLSFNNSLTSA